MNAGFTEQSFFVATSDGRNFTFTAPVTYCARDGRLFRIPEGATTDGASTPPILWQTLPPFGAYWRAAALHDAAYRNTLQKQNDTGTDWIAANLTKDECDALLLEAMELDGVDAVQRDAIYEGVHLGGFEAFKEDRG